MVSVYPPAKVSVHVSWGRLLLGGTPTVVEVWLLVAMPV